MFIDLLPGIIWSCFLGLAIGNFATNPIYRLPRYESLFGKNPYCGDCGSELKPKDLFPVLSWLSTKGKCRYCGGQIPAAYTITEALIALLFVVCYLKFGFSEQFILITFGITAFTMLWAMLYIDNFFSEKTFVAALIFGMLYQTLQTNTIYGFCIGGYIGIIAGVTAWKLSGKTMIRDYAYFPNYMKLLTLAGVWLPLPQMTMLLLLIAVATLILHTTKMLRNNLIEYFIIATTIGIILTYPPY